MDREKVKKNECEQVIKSGITLLFSLTNRCLFFCEIIIVNVSRTCHIDII